MTTQEAIATLTIMQMNKAMNVVEALDIAHIYEGMKQ